MIKKDELFFLKTLSNFLDCKIVSQKGFSIKIGIFWFKKNSAYLKLALKVVAIITPFKLFRFLISANVPHIFLPLKKISLFFLTIIIEMLILLLFFKCAKNLCPVTPNPIMAIFSKKQAC